MTYFLFPCTHISAVCWRTDPRILLSQEGESSGELASQNTVSDSLLCRRRIWRSVPGKGRHGAIPGHGTQRCRERNLLSDTGGDLAHPPHRNARLGCNGSPCFYVPTICSLCIVLFHQDSAMESHRLDTSYGGSQCNGNQHSNLLGQEGGQWVWRILVRDKDLLLCFLQELK